MSNNNKKVNLRLFTIVTLVFFQVHMIQAQWKGKFEQLDDLLPTPNSYRSADGSPGPDYWQQKADYNIKVTLDDKNQRIIGKET
ncbi:MAG: M1 family peptidase, partial [Fulvivirga sp.]